MAELKFPTLEDLGKQVAEWALDEFEYKGYTIRGWADKITTGEYQPVKHGYWYHDDEGHVRCSVCHGREPNGAAIYTYCPNCGAKMDGESE